jgi:hypothetical protein
MHILKFISFLLIIWNVGSAMSVSTHNTYNLQPNWMTLGGGKRLVLQGVRQKEEGERVGPVPQPAQPARHLHTEHGSQVHRVFASTRRNLVPQTGKLASQALHIVKTSRFFRCLFCGPKTMFASTRIRQYFYSSAPLFAAFFPV